MVEPVTPAADLVTAEAVVVGQHRAVVPATTWLVDAAKAAARGGRALQVRTPEHSRLTFPLELLLRDGLGDWVAGDRDGFRGFPLTWNGLRFVRDAGRAPEIPVHVPGSGELEVRIVTADPPRPGASVETAMRALTGGPPLGWGVAEPVTQPWSTDDLADHLRRRHPRPVNVVVAGDGVIGRLRMSQVDGVVVEDVELSGPAAGTVARAGIEALATESARTARLVVVGAHPGRRSGLRSPGVATALPYGVLFGPELVAENGIAHAHRAPAARVKLLGSGRHTAVWCRFDGDPAPPYEQFAALLHHFGAD
ncbi:hypothetical protein H4696_002640 [Amycolatopsis lexingtonensis]|uniref:Uncharacterized protein n=1 Tax=Amycolatopsis lexingtonensis TaxID=218822 RepID=A0ABR9HX72_9PSEU|nr:DUF6177 family protein [Amycolatopsis lexingtonensis]MBE1495540.1 hypothetical protein [Amycolatopsis lexingtonensis]